MLPYLLHPSSLHSENLGQRVLLTPKARAVATDKHEVAHWPKRQTESLSWANYPTFPDYYPTPSLPPTDTFNPTERAQ